MIDNNNNDNNNIIKNGDEDDELAVFRSSRNFRKIGKNSKSVHKKAIQLPTTFDSSSWMISKEGSGRKGGGGTSEVPGVSQTIIEQKSLTTIVDPVASIEKGDRDQVEETVLYDDDTEYESEVEEVGEWNGGGCTALESFDRFFEEPQEEQDPCWLAYQAKVHRTKVMTALHELESMDQKGLAEIEEIVQQQNDEKQKQTEASFEKYKARFEQERSQRMARLQQWYRQKTASDSQKINDGIKLLQSRHQKEMQNALQQHRQKQQQQNQRRGGMQPESFVAASNAEWQQISQQMQMEHSLQTKDFTKKGEDAKKKTEADYQREHDKIIKDYERRLSECEVNRQKLKLRNTASAQQARQRFIKRHQLTLTKHRELLLQQLHSDPTNNHTVSLPGVTDDTTLKTPHQSLMQLNQPAEESLSSVCQETTTTTTNITTDEILRPLSPIRSFPHWVSDCSRYDYLSSAGGASARYKHRKQVMTQAARQITVEIHNEGLWITLESDDSSSSSKNNSGDGGNATVPAAATTTATTVPTATTATTATTSDSKGQDDPNNTKNVKDEVAKLHFLSSTPLENREFLSWSPKSCVFLESIVCGEIPSGYDHLFRRLHQDTIFFFFFQIRCVLMDLRTSEGTASEMRAMAMDEYQEAVIADLEKRLADQNRMRAEAEKVTLTAEARLRDQEKIVEGARRDLEKAKRIQDDFINQFRSFLGPDGKPLPQTNRNDCQELMNALMSYKNEVETAARNERNASQMLDDIRPKLLKVQAVAKETKLQASSISEVLIKRKLSNPETADAAKQSTELDFSETDIEFFSASLRVNDVIGALKKTADKRRENATHRSSLNFSTTAWMDSLPGLSTAVKKYLCHKMHRRKHQIILRPSPEYLFNQMKAHVDDVLMSSRQKGPTDEEMVHAEQLYLLAVHPLNSEYLSSVPPIQSDDKWAEPGWFLNLDVPRLDENTESLVLPRAKSFPIVENCLAQMSSSSGRQAASFLHSVHLRCLASPLSLFSMASSPSETSTSLCQNANHNEGDPLYITEENLDAGYDFSLTKPRIKRPLVSRKRKIPENAKYGGGESSVSSSPLPTHQHGSSIGNTDETQIDKKKMEPKKRRPSTKITNSISSPRSQKGKKIAENNTQQSINSVAMNAQPQLVPKQPIQLMQHPKQQQQQLQDRRQQKVLQSQQQPRQQQSIVQQQKPQMPPPMTQQHEQQRKQPSKPQFSQPQHPTAQTSLLQQHQHANHHARNHPHQSYQAVQSSQQQQSPKQQLQRHQFQQQHQQTLQQQQQAQQHVQFQSQRQQSQLTPYQQAYQNQQRQIPQSQQQMQSQQQQQQQQRYTNSQLAQFRMMQQQAQSPNNTNRQLQQQMSGNYSQHQVLQQQMNPFYGASLTHPTNAPMGYMQQQQQQQQQRSSFSNPSTLSGLPGGSPTGQQQLNNNNNIGMNNDPNDPMFLLK